MSPTKHVPCTTGLPHKGSIDDHILTTLRRKQACRQISSACKFSPEKVPVWHKLDGAQEPDESAHNLSRAPSGCVGFEAAS